MIIKEDCFPYRYRIHDVCFEENKPQILLVNKESNRSRVYCVLENKFGPPINSSFDQEVKWLFTWSKHFGFMIYCCPSINDCEFYEYELFCPKTGKEIEPIKNDSLIIKRSSALSISENNIVCCLRGDICFSSLQTNIAKELINQIKSNENKGVLIRNSSKEWKTLDVKFKPIHSHPLISSISDDGLTAIVASGEHFAIIDLE